MAEETKEFEKEIELLKKENAELNTQLKSAFGIVEEQNKEIDRLKNGDRVSKPQVKVGKATYEVNNGVRKDGQVFTSEEIAANPKLAAELVKIGSTALSEVTED